MEKEVIDVQSDLKFRCSFGCLENLHNSLSMASENETLPKVEVLNSNSIKYEDFFETFLLCNKPCIFTKEITCNWASVRDWVTSEGKLNFKYLREIYGNVSVFVTTITDQMSMEYGGMVCEDMKFNDFIDYWITYIEHDHPSSMPCLYLKDWHIVKDSENIGYEPYMTPKYFQSDWMNEVWTDKFDDDFRFAYMGPKGSWSPFHSDVYGSFSWSANIIGRKKWRLYPPGKEKKFIQQNNQMKYNYENPGTENIDYVEVIQEAGEIIFVPSGWHHIVWNLLDTISINHNWMNASNICHIWHELRKALEEVKLEIDDLKDVEGFSDQCQILLRANFGMNYSVFSEIIEKIYHNRNSADKNAHLNFGPGQIMFDKKAIEHLFHEHLVNDTDFGGEVRSKNLAKVISK